MEYIRPVIQFIADILRFHKSKLVACLLSALVFAIIFFPYDDLGDLIAGQINKQSRGQVYLQFGSMGLSILPSLGAQLEEVYIESADFPPLQVKSATISPSMASLLSFSVGGSIDASGIFGGEAYLSALQTGEASADIAAESSGLQVKELAKYASLPIPLEGQIRLSLNSSVDFKLQEKPEGTVTVLLTNFKFAGGNFNIPGAGPMDLPALDVSKVTAKGRLSRGKLAIEEVKIGEGQDQLLAEVDGTMNLDFASRGPNIVVDTGRYSINIDFTIKKQLLRRVELYASLLDGFIGRYKQNTLNGLRYAFNVSGADFRRPPNFSAKK